jgi:16S rRNA (guanine527-N7)-methyltransferase
VSHLDILDSELRNLQIDLPAAQKLKLARYCDELGRWNQKINLTALSGAEMVRRLVLEPVWIGQQLNFKGKLADVGSGNGSPGIPFQIVCGLELCHLIEARVKRAAFLRQLISELELVDTHVHRARLEEVVTTLGEVDWITLQGVAFAPRLVDSIKKIASTDTTIVWITSSRIDRSARAFRTLHLPFADTQVLLFRLDLS